MTANIDNLVILQTVVYVDYTEADYTSVKKLMLISNKFNIKVAFHLSYLMMVNSIDTYEVCNLNYAPEFQKNWLWKTFNSIFLHPRSHPA